jgi:hypothetical protein
LTVTDGRKRTRTPEELERLKAVGFQKGRERTGGRVATSQEVKDAMAARTMRAVEIAEDLMENSPNDMVRLKALEWMAQSLVSKAPTKVDVTHTHSISDMLTQANQMRLKDNSKTIDITPVAIEIIEPNTTPKLRVSSQRSADND